MKHILIAIVGGMVLCGVSLAQNTMPPQTNGAPPQVQQNPATTQAAQTSPVQATMNPRIAPGSVIPVQLTKTINAKKVKAGDEVQARVTQDMKAGNGQILLAKDTKVLGHITEDQPRTKEQKESHIGIAFDRVVMKNGEDTQLPMSIQAIIGPSNSPADNNANAGAGNSPTVPTSGGMSSGGTMGRSPGMGNGAPTQTQTSPTTGSEWPTTPQPGANAQQPITGNTQGVVGISNLKLSTSANVTQGSLVSSDKSNVKLDSGTLMLLRVVQ